jgi:hypothetical protein
VLPRRHESKNTNENKKENTRVMSQKNSFDDSEQLSAYELLRQRNIEERQSLFQELNLNQVNLCLVRRIPTPRKPIKYVIGFFSRTIPI